MSRMRPEFKNTSRESGMTLLELSFAVFVILFGLLGIMSMYPAAIELADRSLNVSDGAMVAKYAKYDMILHKNDMDRNAISVVVWPPRAEAYSADNSRLFREGTVVKLLDINENQLSYSDRTTRAVGILCENPKGRTVNFTDCFTNRLKTSQKGDYYFYLLLTSGPAKGRVYPIKSTVKGTNKLICSTNVKKDPNVPDVDLKVDLNKDGVAEGDTYRILGWAGKSNSCWPKEFTKGTWIAENVARSLPRKGDPVFRYGIIISPPEQGSDGACRIDILCYRFGRFRTNIPIFANPRPFAWNVSHVSVY